MIKTFTKRILKGWPEKYADNGLFRNFVSVLGIDILVRTSGFILLPIFLRLMSQEEFGLYNYFLSIIQTFSLVLNLGLYIAQTRLYHVASGAAEKGRLLFTIYSTLIAFLVIIFFIGMIFRFDVDLVRLLFNNHPAYQAFREILIGSLLITVFNFMLTNYLYTSEKIRQVKRYNISRIIGVNVVSLLALFLVGGDAVRTRLMFTYLTELVLFLFFLVPLIREMVPVFSTHYMKRSFIVGLPIMISSVFGIVVNFSDKFLLQKFGTSIDLSNYYLAFSFAGIIALIIASLQSVWLPVFMKEKDVKSNFLKTKKLLNKLLLFFLPAAVSIWILFELLLWSGIIPVKYNEVSAILPVLLVTQLFAAISPLFSNYLVYFEKTQLILVSGFLVSILSIGLGFALVPRWGVFGAAVTALLANAAYFLLYYLLSRKLIKLNLGSIHNQTAMIS